ncbi:esterase family protein [Peribacillus saganii]|uniref:Esterase family protein n=1 Tax=Peribacillus saganii TaxID=2303992 RepID=A0A372LQL2_9BACI|nr:alpha/beta hydrolase-fold protein [Peribacillus saganii]RFU69217.1 esterase family protein [Peribacillus saganii]
MNVAKGTIKEYSLFSEELGEEMELLIYLPASFSTLYKYSILITQDGRDYFQLGRIGRTADSLLHEGEIENIIIVGIPYRNVNDRRSKYHPEGEKHQAYMRFLAHELVPFLDREFPGYHMGRGRALIGDSLGATISLLTALRYPHTFGKVALQSPYVDDKVMEEVRKFQDTQLLELYHVIGKNETEVPTTDGRKKNFIEPNRELQALFQSKGFSCFYDEFDGEHSWKYWQPDLKRALMKMF